MHKPPAECYRLAKLRQHGASCDNMPSDGESEADEHELSSEADEHELSLDEHGRTAIGGTCDYRPRVWDGVVAEAAVPALVADCKAA